ncbi:hypothetical protein ACI2K4_29545 [Micromonospora sp. NPDC050397]|uniref:hypothetical protein n=1 Tax=Micromonospora sp. NPDC050397 TaxID=3364279 RepID=UPI00384AA80D
MFRLLEATTPEPLPEGHPFAERTAEDVEAVLSGLGWHVISRAAAAAELHAAGYRLDIRRAAGHLLYADGADDSTWRTHSSGYCLKAFAAPIRREPAQPPER